MAGKGRPGPGPSGNPRALKIGLSLYPTQLEWLKKTAAADTGRFGWPSVSKVVQSLIDKEMGK